jgi:hypothetical protein
MKVMDDDIKPKTELGQESLDSTSAKCVAGQHLATMSASARASVAKKLNKTVKTARNKAVTQAVLAEEYTKKVVECTIAHLKLLSGNIVPTFGNILQHLVTFGNIW